jgi:hypothetical protein
MKRISSNKQMELEYFLSDELLYEDSSMSLGEIIILAN